MGNLGTRTRRQAVGAKDSDLDWPGTVADTATSAARRMDSSSHPANTMAAVTLLGGGRCHGRRGGSGFVAGWPARLRPCLAAADVVAGKPVRLGPAGADVGSQPADGGYGFVKHVDGGRGWKLRRRRWRTPSWQRVDFGDGRNKTGCNVGGVVGDGGRETKGEKGETVRRMVQGRRRTD